jgi:hypothetical protein
MNRRYVHASVMAAVLGVSGASVRAQTGVVPPPYAEYRLDAIQGRGTAVHAGAGLTIPAGTYVRVAAIGAIGPRWDHGETTLSGRTDLIARFLFDPLRQTPVALSLGGGVSVPYETGERVRPYLTAVIDVEGRQRSGLAPALQVGLGGGVRVGVVLRTTQLRRR